MVNKKNKVGPTSFADVKGWVEKELQEMSPEKREQYEEFRKKALAALVKKNSFWSKTKWFLKTLGCAFLDLIFLLSVIAIFGSIFLIIWDPVTANFQLFATSVLFFVFLMTMIGIFNQD